MKAIKKLLLMGAIIGFTTVSFAQQTAKQAPTPEIKAQKMTDKMTKELSLTKDQAVKIKAIYLQMEQKRAELKASGQTDKADMQTYKADIKKVLTSEQLQKMKELEEAHSATKTPQPKK